jgi:hypothetical protein
MTNGTCNGGDRGNTEDRRRRRVWLVKTFRADVDVRPLPRPWLDVGRVEWEKSVGVDPTPVPLGTGEPACRCYRCAALLTVETVTPDRIKPGCKGGTYRRDNLRPACSRCQSVTGNIIKAELRNAA